MAPHPDPRAVTLGSGEAPVLLGKASSAISTATSMGLWLLELIPQASPLASKFAGKTEKG